MIKQYLLNKNKSVIGAENQNFCQLNKSYIVVSLSEYGPTLLSTFFLKKKHQNLYKNHRTKRLVRRGPGRLDPARYDVMLMAATRPEA
jgi:hypothetical protein